MKDIKEIMDIETAQLELLGVAEFFETTFDDDSLLLPIAMVGRLYLDENQKKVIYKLNRQIELANGSTLTEFKLKNPSAEDQVKINKGVKASVKEGGETTIDMGQQYEKTMKATMILSDQPLGVINRMSRSDLSDLMSLLSFL